MLSIDNFVVTQKSFVSQDETKIVTERFAKFKMIEMQRSRMLIKECIEMEIGIQMNEFVMRDIKQEFEEIQNFIKFKVRSSRAGHQCGRGICGSSFGEARRCGQ